MMSSQKISTLSKINTAIKYKLSQYVCATNIIRLMTNKEKQMKVSKKPGQWRSENFEDEGAVLENVYYPFVYIKCINWV